MDLNTKKLLLKLCFYAPILIFSGVIIYSGIIVNSIIPFLTLIPLFIFVIVSGFHISRTRGQE